jgi:hypothetical protein
LDFTIDANTCEPIIIEIEGFEPYLEFYERTSQYPNDGDFVTAYTNTIIEEYNKIFLK